MMVRKLFFEWRYLVGRAPWDTGVSPPELLSFVDSHTPGQAIDIGCGTGTNVLTLARRGWRVTGIDFSRQAIRRARRRLAASGYYADLRLQDVTDLSGLEGPFDLALDLGCFHGLTPAGQELYASHLARLVELGGTFLLYTFLRTDPSDGLNWPAEAGLQTLFSRAFDLVDLTHGLDHGRHSAWISFLRKTR